MDLKLDFEVFINKIRNKLNRPRRDDIIEEDSNGEYVQ